MAFKISLSFTRPQTTTTEEPEVLFAGQAFDIEPSRPPVQRPEIFDLTVSVQQNFGGKKRVPPQNEGKASYWIGW